MRTSTGVLAGCLVLATVSVPVVSAVGRAGPEAATGQGRGAVGAGAGPVETVRAELTIRHRRVTPAGVPIGLPRPDVSMRYERLRRDGRWVTVVSRLGDPRVSVRGLTGPEAVANPFHVARVELTEGDRQPRMFDAAGNAVRGLAPGDLAMVRATGVGPTKAGYRPSDGSAGRLLITRAETAGQRRAALVGRFGASTGRVRGYDRYTSISAVGRYEVLVDPTTALPAEVRTTLAAGGQMHTGVEYRALPGYGHVRRLLRSEYHFAGNLGRAVTEVEVTDLVLSGEVWP